MSIFKNSLIALGIISFIPFALAEEKAVYDSSVGDVANTATRSDFNESDIPCPFGWSVKPNPSLDNSLSYVTADGSLSCSVTYIKPEVTRGYGAETYSRVSAEQMKCDLPVKSDLIADAWSFNCPDSRIEAVIYGDGQSGLVLLAIAGRSASTDKDLDDFIRFLANEAKRR
ncbi:MAG: hypothetical protein J5934_06885 [Succinivibrio sp.]|nr:hypothetical protein [Succinivibrio sp.]